MRSVLALAIAVAVTGCRYEGTYTCATNDQCRSRAAPGVCQLPAGVCSFPDPTCAMGQRYDDTAGDVAGECVGAMPPVDGSVFNPEDCPTGYTAVPGTTSSRYRILPALAATETFPKYMAACEANKPGYTHAAVIDSAAEAQAIAAMLGPTSGQHYIGAIQDPAATQPGDGWLTADGVPLLADLWSTVNTEPDDDDNTEDGAEQAGAFNSTGFFDVPGRSPNPVLCECDGKPVSASFRTAVAATSFN